MLNIKIEQIREANITMLGLEGSMDSLSGNTITNMVRAEIAAGEKHFIIEMSKVDFINSMSVLDLLHAKDRVRFCNGVLKICGVRPGIYKILKDIGLSGLLDFESTVEDAIKAISKEASK